MNAVVAENNRNWVEPLADRFQATSPSHPNRNNTAKTDCFQQKKKS